MQETWVQSLGSEDLLVMRTATHSSVTILCIYHVVLFIMGSPGSSSGKESACNAGNPGSIPGLGRSFGEKIGYPLQYSWASLVAQLLKNPPAMWEIWVQSLGWEDLPEKQ